jgi:hypothetical protein
MLSLADIAAANPGKTVSRVYLTEGMGDSYHSNPHGTFAWVDKATISGVTYDFEVEDEIPAVPEFGAIVGILTALGALSVFFVVRRK